MNLHQFLATSVAILGALGALWLLFKESSRIEKRIGQRVRDLGRKSAGGGTPADGVIKPVTIAATASTPEEAAYEQKRLLLQSRLQHAGIYWASAVPAYHVARGVLLVLPLLAGVIAGQLGYVSARSGLLAGIVLGGLGLFLPSLWLDRRKARRQAVLNKSLPDALDIMVTCVEAGLSMEAALLRVTEELRLAHPLLANELSVVQRQIEFGASQEGALRNFAERTDLESIFTLSSLVQYARRFGTGVAEALRTHAEMLRYEREQLAEELAQKAAVKVLFPTLLLIFPSIFIVVAGPAVIQLQENLAKQNQKATVK